MYTCMGICIYIYIYIHRERERERYTASVRLKGSPSDPNLYLEKSRASLSLSKLSPKV